MISNYFLLYDSFRMAKNIIRRNKTRAQRTNQPARSAVRSHRASRTAVTGKDPDYEYSFKRRVDVLTDGGSAMQEGWEAINKENSKGENWETANHVRTLKDRTKATGEIHFHDTVLCRRHKEDAAYFKNFEDRKYNAQMKLLNEAAKDAKQKLRPIGDQAGLKDEFKQTGRQFTQRAGPTEA